MKILNNIRCEKNQNEDSFKISWDSEPQLKNYRIYIAEIAMDESEFELNDFNVHKIDGRQENIFSIKTLLEPSQHRFLVIGIEKDTQPSYSAITEWCKQQSLEKISCFGLSASGKIIYNLKELNNKKLCRVTLKSEDDVPGGYIYYYYDFCGIRFYFPMMYHLYANEEVQFDIYIPEGAGNIAFQSDRTQLQFQNGNFIKRGNDVTKKLLDKLINLFR